MMANPVLDFASPWRRRERISAASSDEALARAAADGDHHAFDELVRRYQDKIYAVLASSVGREHAVDLTQEVFVKAYRSLHRFRGDASFYTWLYRIAVNTVIDERRRSANRPGVTSLEDEALCETGFEPLDLRPGSDPERLALNGEVDQLLHNSIAALPDVMRDVIVLHDVVGLTQGEIAATVGCPLGTVKSRLKRAREEVRRRLAPALSDLPS